MLKETPMIQVSIFKEVRSASAPLLWSLVIALGWPGPAAAGGDLLGEQSLNEALGVVVPEPQIVNPSFEVGSFQIWPGYVADNGGVSGWEGSSVGNWGLNPISNGQSPFADNGAIPDGTQVGFLQSSPGGESRLSTLMTGLLPGSSYVVRFRANARSSNSVLVQVAVSGELREISLNGGPPALSQTISPVGGSNPYHRVSLVFTAVVASQALTIINGQGGDNTVLIDDFELLGDRAFADRFIAVPERLGFENLASELLPPGAVRNDGPFVLQVLSGDDWEILPEGNPGQTLSTGFQFPDIGDSLSIRRSDGGRFLFSRLDLRTLTTEPSDGLELQGRLNGQVLFSVGGISSSEPAWQTLEPGFDVAIDEVLLRIDSRGAEMLMLDNLVFGFLSN
ncbi:hypothetical protein HNQ63_001134 [Wenzhouxiangella marina]|uniref:Uncharacterized protein n=2 Tax=Wenzhouxiangella marina TaxID=1579979 RepID=A0A0K0XV07_9GAMM|nr:hypothetical protein WM2015_1170 [Wenzhouxiangella marina]MBB6086697.1 hypothetical protein [Wenzhouxiangella marina]